MTRNGARDTWLAALYLVPFAGIAFLWFLAALRRRIGRLEDQFFSTVFLGSGLMFVAMLFAASAAASAALAAGRFGADPRARPDSNSGGPWPTLSSTSSP